MKKRYISTLFILVFTLLISGCTVNDYLGAITIQNRANIAANNIKIGNFLFGYLAPGQTRTVYFSMEENDALIDMTPFQPPSGYNSTVTIDLKKNYHYNCELQIESDGSYRMKNFTGYKQSSYVSQKDYQISIK